MTGETVLWYIRYLNDAGWSSLVARRAHNPKVRGSNPLPATNQYQGLADSAGPFFNAILCYCTQKLKGACRRSDDGKPYQARKRLLRAVHGREGGETGLPGNRFPAGSKEKTPPGGIRAVSGRRWPPAPPPRRNHPARPLPTRSAMSRRWPARSTRWPTASSSRTRK